MKYDFNKIIDRLLFWNKHDEKMQTALNEYTSKVGEGSHDVVISSPVTTGYIDAFKQVDPKICFDLEYFLYETPIFNNKTEISTKTKKYTFNQTERSEFIDYLNDHYNKK